MNIPRSPLAGRNFECYSEDPLLSGALAAAFIRGAQAHAVATTVKHFVGNDAEFERYTMSSVIDERSLREIYLVPFEQAVRQGGVRRDDRVQPVERDMVFGRSRPPHRDPPGEWSFDGFVLTDWYGVASTVGSSDAGVDLEMPGPGRAYGPALADAVRAGSVSEGASISWWGGCSVSTRGSGCSTGPVVANNRSGRRRRAARPWPSRRRPGLSCC